MVCNIYSECFQYVSIHSWLIKSVQAYEYKTHGNEAIVETQYFYYVIIFSRNGNRQIENGLYVTSLGGGVHWWGEKRIKIYTQSNDPSMLTWHLIYHREEKKKQKQNKALECAKSWRHRNKGDF